MSNDKDEMERCALAVTSLDAFMDLFLIVWKASAYILGISCRLTNFLFMYIFI